MRDSPLLSSTPREWIAAPLADFNEFLIDHAACEKKAAALAMSLVVKYPDRKALIDPMVSLAREELEHFQQVFRLMNKRGLELPQKDAKDHYINLILPHIRHGRETRFLDKLIMSALVEARGHERFGLLATGLTEEPLARFYYDLAQKEAGHYRIFLRIAQFYFSQDLVDEALARLGIVEAEAIANTPYGPRLH